VCERVGGGRGGAGDIYGSYSKRAWNWTDYNSTEVSLSQRPLMSAEITAPDHNSGPRTVVVVTLCGRTDSL